MPGSSGRGSTVPKACRTPTSPGSITTMSAVTAIAAPIIMPMKAKVRISGALLFSLKAAATNSSTMPRMTRMPPKTSLLMETPSWRDTGDYGRQAAAGSTERIGAARLLVARAGPRSLRSGAHVAHVLVARDALLRREALEHQLARGDDAARFLLAR